ncbi:MAG: PIN domain protein [bacterium]
MRIYVDTSVFGGCFDPEFEKWSNKLILNFRSGKYKAVISEISRFELKYAPDKVNKVVSEIPKEYVEFVKITDEARNLSVNYLNEKVVTKRSVADTLHIAIATIEKVDLLVSWNFKHIVNYDKIHRYNSVNIKYGYRTLEIRNPRDLTDE